jgi:hypothetical protein
MYRQNQSALFPRLIIPIDAFILCLLAWTIFNTRLESNSDVGLGRINKARDCQQTFSFYNYLCVAVYNEIFDGNNLWIITRSYVFIYFLWYYCIVPLFLNPLLQPIRRIMLIPNPRFTYAFTSVPRRPIALLNALIIPSYIMSLLRNVPVKIALSLIGKGADQRS